MITIGTDCSGIEAPIEALKQLGIPFQHKWACEIDKYARQSILANYQPETMYDDITKRDHSQLPDVDLYVCGFPCQSFSLMGRKLGMLDPRGNIMNHCIEVIKHKQPPIFILENVKNFCTIENGKPFQYLIDTLSNLSVDNQQLYSIYWNIYNTKDYGIPQDRKRVYIVGIQQNIQIREFVQPQHIPLTDLDIYIQDKQVHTPKTHKCIQEKLKQIKHSTNYVFPNSNYVNPKKNICPTLTTRCDMFYHTTYHRYLTVTECLTLQGFSESFVQVVSNSQMFRQIGNSMSVNVLKTIMNEIVNSTLFNEII
jgi:DNA (cytosine-5)-methyltransferase 1